MKIYATIEIVADIDAETPEQALAEAVQYKDFAILSSRLADQPPAPPKYIPLTEYAKKNNMPGCTYLRKQAEAGTLPGAIKIGHMWCVPEDMVRPDNRITNGYYVRWRQGGWKETQAKLKAAREAAKETR